MAYNPPLIIRNWAGDLNSNCQLHKPGDRRNYKNCWKCRVNDERPTGKKTTSEWNDVGKIGKIILTEYNGYESGIRKSWTGEWGEIGKVENKGIKVNKFKIWDEF